MHALLEAIDSPHSLRQLGIAQLPDLADELRAFIVDSVSRTGGHFASNLGTVELTVALHYVFDTPRDRIVWDVGHQSYAHKILTGRRQGMASLRQFGGISGFPRRAESEHDHFGTAHSSTSISAALGFAQAARISNSTDHAIAVIGDGALSAGMAFEAMNNTQACGRLLVILNDNDMSISPPVGMLRLYLGGLISERAYACANEASRQRLRAMRPALDPCEPSDLGLSPATLFEQFGFHYTGPIDGHDLGALVPALQRLQAQPGPQLLHIVTQKGHGYRPAEQDPILYHGPGKFDPVVGIKTAPAAATAKPTYAQVFSDWLCDEAEADARVTAITPAMREGSALMEFERRFPERYFDVGIAEQHAVTFAAGLAAAGMRPVVAIYSTFLQRAYDQLIHDVALQNLPVVFAVDRAGIVGADGATHMGAFDIAYLRCIPNLVVMAASDENECRQMLHTALRHDGPAAVRYPRGSGPGALPVRQMQPLHIGRGHVRRESTQPMGARIAILAFGTMVAPSLAAAERLDATVANLRFIKPLDAELVLSLAEAHDVLVTVEEGCVRGGAGAACLESLAAQGVLIPSLQLGLPDQFVEHGDCAKLLAAHGLDADGLVQSIQAFFDANAPAFRTARMSLVS